MSKEEDFYNKRDDKSVLVLRMKKSTTFVRGGTPGVQVEKRWGTQKKEKSRRGGWRGVGKKSHHVYTEKKKKGESCRMNTMGIGKKTKKKKGSN